MLCRIFIIGPCIYCIRVTGHFTGFIVDEFATFSKGYAPLLLTFYRAIVCKCIVLLVSNTRLCPLNRRTIGIGNRGRLHYRYSDDSSLDRSPRLVVDGRSGPFKTDAVRICTFNCPSIVDRDASPTSFNLDSVITASDIASRIFDRDISPSFIDLDPVFTTSDVTSIICDLELCPATLNLNSGLTTDNLSTLTICDIAVRNQDACNTSLNRVLHCGGGRHFISNIMIGSFVICHNSILSSKCGSIVCDKCLTTAHTDTGIIIAGDSSKIKNFSAIMCFNCSKYP
ncbi:MAG: hypothetical protein A4E65_00238 [Syntrophorhabdus sp. PtaU1.Bin153]|nr:MAG: hypothetical protein A4E65_00238 [Syntrophorhabdus sp. PtaU1.Bin153]